MVHIEVQMGVGGCTGGSHISDDLSLRDIASGGNGHGAHVSVQGGIPIPVVDGHVVSESAGVIGDRGGSGRCGVDGAAVRGADIHTGVDFIRSGNGMIPVTVGTGDGTYRGGLDEHAGGSGGCCGIGLGNMRGPR